MAPLPLPVAQPRYPTEITNTRLIPLLQAAVPVDALEQELTDLFARTEPKAFEKLRGPTTKRDMPTLCLSLSKLMQRVQGESCSSVSSPSPATGTEEDPFLRLFDRIDYQKSDWESLFFELGSVLKQKGRPSVSLDSYNITLDDMAVYIHFSSDYGFGELCKRSYCCASLLRFLSDEHTPLFLATEERLSRVTDFIQVSLHTVTKAIGHDTDPPEYISALLPRICLCLKELVRLHGRTKMNESLLLKMIRMSFDTFECQQIPPDIHLLLSRVLYCIFYQTPSLRNEIMVELIHALKSSSDSTKHLRFFNVMDGHSTKLTVNLLTALSLQLIQALYSVDKVTSALAEYIPQTNDSAASTTRSFVARLCQAFFREHLTEGGTLTSLRGPISEFTDDILRLLFLPEWPIAQELTGYLFAYLFNYASSNENAAHTRTLAIEVLGSICIALGHHSTQREKLRLCFRQEEIQVDDKATAIDEQEKTACFCGCGPRNEFMLDCDLCHHWFHGACVNVDERDSDVLETKGWLCPLCSTKGAIERCSSVASEGVSTATMERLVLLQSLHLDKKSKMEHPEIQSAQRYLLSKWYVHDTEHASSLVENQWNAENHIHLDRIHRKHIVQLVRQIPEVSPLLDSFHSYLDMYLTFIRDRISALRVKVVKSLSVVVEQQTSLLTSPSIQWAIKEGLGDRYTSVREAILELLGKYLLLNPEIISTYFDVLARRTTDRGLGVRKRVIKIIQQVCLRFPDHELFPRFCALLIQRVQDDEPTIRQILLKTINTLWFELPQQGRSERTHKLACQIALIFSELDQETVSRLFESLFEGSSKMDTIFSICHMIVGHLVSQVVENPGELTDVSQEIWALHAFAKVRPVFLLPHLSLLEPLMKETDTINVHRLVSIALMCLPIADARNKSVFMNLEPELRRMVVSCPGAIIRDAVSCLCILQSRFIPYVANKFLTRIRAYMEQPRSQDVETVCRCIYVLGQIARCRDLDTLLGSKGSASQEFMGFLGAIAAKGPARLQQFAAEALFSVYSRSPLLMVRTQGTAHAFLTMASAAEVQHQALLGMKTLLDVEDSCTRYLQRIRQRQQDPHPAVSEANFHTGDYYMIRLLRSSEEEDHHGALCGVMQQYLPAVIRLARSSAVTTRQSAFCVVFRLARQLLVNPQLCASTLVGLTCDYEDSIAASALSAFRTFYEKHSTLVHVSCVGGFVSLFDVVQQTYPSKAVLDADSMSKLAEKAQLAYQVLFSESQAQKKRFSFWGALFTQAFQKDVSSIMHVERNVFLCSLVSNMSFQSSEPLYLTSLLSQLIGILSGRIDDDGNDAAAISQDNLLVMCTIIALILSHRILQQKYSYRDASQWDPMHPVHLEPRIVSPEFVNLVQQLPFLQGGMAAPDTIRGMYLELLSGFDTFESRSMFSPKRRRRKSQVLTSSSKRARVTIPGGPNEEQ